MLSAIQIINQVIKFYTKEGHPRSKIGEDDFFYHTKIDGVLTKCPVGQCMYKKYSYKKYNWEYKTLEQINKLFNGLDNLLCKRYRGQPLIFWKDLQFLHDHDEFWDEPSDGKLILNQSGVDHANFLKKFYTLGAPKENENLIMV